MREGFLKLIKTFFCVTPMFDMTDVRNAFGKNSKEKVSIYKQNKQFFSGSAAPYNPVAVLVWIIIAIVAISCDMAFFGILIFIAVAFCVFVSVKTKCLVTAKEVNSNIWTIIEQKKQDGLNALGICVEDVDVVEPLCSAIFYGSDIKTKYLVKDNMSSNVSILWLYVGINRLYFYNETCSIINEDEKTWEAYDFSYNDIVNSNINANSDGNVAFELKLCSGEVKTYKFNPNTTEDVYMRLTAIKNLIRDKRDS